MALGIYYLSTGIMDTAYDSQVLPLLRAAMKHGADLVHISFDPFRRSTMKGYVEKRKELESMGVRTFYCRQAPPVWKGAFYRDVRRVSLACDPLRSENERIVIHGRGQLNAYRGLLLKRLNPEKVKVVADLRGVVGDEVLCGAKGGAGRFLARYLAAFYRGIEAEVVQEADAILCVSKAFKEYLQRTYRITNVTVIPTFVDTSQFFFSKARREAYRERLGISDRMVFAFSGGGAPWQRPQDVIRLFVTLKQKIENLYMLFLSANALQMDRMMADQIRPTDGKAVSVPHKEVASYLCASDVGILLRENRLTNQVAAPIKFGEYLCCGLPCILSENIGDTGEVIRESGAGIVLDSKRLEPTVSEVQHLLTLDRERISETMRRRYASDVYLAEILALYQQLADPNMAPLKGARV